VLRASIPSSGVSGGDLLDGFGASRSVFSDETLDFIDALNANDKPPVIP
jgi:hypothetical protein